ncbi:MAG: peptide-methionine (R)-S-oxide reductase MsrB [Saprospiraceae bacterium]
MPKDSLLVAPQYDQAGKLIKVEKSRADWKKQLTADEFYILREQGTERAGSGDLLNEHSHGVFVCAGCGLPLFGSEAKFESGTGWPSFFQPLDAKYVQVATDNTLGMSRDEVACARCGGHLGHVFNDGPKPTGLRYCMDSGAMNFVKQ